MAKMKDKPFDKLYAQVEDVKDAKGNKLNTVLFNKYGTYSVIMEIENPVQQYCTEAAQYYGYMDILYNICQTLGEGYCLQKQDVFCRQLYSHPIEKDMSFLYKSYFTYFTGRPFTEIRTFLVITQESKQSSFVKYDPKKWTEFHQKVAKVTDILKEKGIPYHKLDKQEVDEYLHRFMSFNFKKGPFSMDNMNVTDEYIKMGQRAVKSFSLVDVDLIDLPPIVQPYAAMNVNGYRIAKDLFTFLADVPFTDCVIYNQTLMIPPQRMQQRKMAAKAKRHDSMPDPSNKIAKADIDAVLDLVARESKLIVKANFNIIASCPLNKIGNVTSFIETKMFDVGIMPSKSCYNQLELFQCSFPGMSYIFNRDYDQWETLCETALCFFFKEHMKHSEDANLNVWYTDRQGVPVSIDITGKEGKVKMTDNANFFCLGPSGSGKSFHMNSVVAQLLMQGTDVVMVDTGDSYEGISHYFHGTYITYSKDHPISMNPFSITEEEYKLNFGEKKTFLQNLIFLIFKGSEPPTKIEENIINQTLVEYYEEYFHPFSGYTEEQKKIVLKRLQLEDKKTGKYEAFVEKLEERYGDKYDIPELDELRRQVKERTNVDINEREKRQIPKLKAILEDASSTQGEKDNARYKLEQIQPGLSGNQLALLTPAVIEKKYLDDIDGRLKKLEDQRRKLQVTTLNFNSYYEFALERIPQICAEKKVEFDVDRFGYILEKFYKGGELEYTLNNDLDQSLFDEKFIVFEIDKIKDDPVLFPIVVLIIMDVFLQKMRLKKGRKALIIEEAWKAISTPTMANYIKYLYKTVRKFNGIAGVVTQELNDVIDSPIVKEAIINNADVKILLDQSKFKDRYEQISAILGLTDVQRSQIFTVNALPSKEGIPYHKEVWIARGQNSDVYSVEVPPEWYWAFTTERVEKEALKVYERAFDDNIERAIEEIEKDRKKMKISRYFDFAVMVNKHQAIMDHWQ